METAEEVRSLPGHPTALPGRALKGPSAAVILVEHCRRLSPSSENPFLGRSFHLGDVFYTLSSWNYNVKDPLLDQGVKARTVSGHRANSSQQETGREPVLLTRSSSLASGGPFPLLCPHAAA